MTKKDRFLLYSFVILSIFLIFQTVQANQKEALVRNIAQLAVENMQISQYHMQNQTSQEHFLQQMNIVDKQILQLKNDIVKTKQKRFLTQDDIEALNKIVEVEATAEGLKGKTLVACVVLNRWQKTNKTVEEIITQKGQFDPVTQGKYFNAVATKETMKAVNLALIRDYSNGSTYFMNPKISSRGSITWFHRSLQMTVEHRNHQFYKEKEEKEID